MAIRIVEAEAPAPSQREAILAPLLAYNTAVAGDPGIAPLALLLTDEHGDERGGLWGRFSYDWLFVELLAVPEDLRGQGLGRELMERAEALARARGCKGIWLDTFEFGARGLYEKLGFTVFGSIEAYVGDQNRYFLQKRWDAAPIHR